MAKTLKHDLKADTLLDKGIELLWSKGYNATSVNDIVKVAGIPKGSFYFYFESKEDFAVKAIEKYFDDHFTPAKEILQNKAVSPKQRLLDFHEFRYNILKNEMDCKMGCMACNLGNEMSEHSELIRTSILHKEQEVLSIITEVIQEAQDFGEINNTMAASDIAAFIEDAGKGSMTTMKEMNDSYPIDNFMNMIRNVLLK
ncbi:TetR/AcrR family transcriptional regulator [Psychroserpens luteolus]|uniref:TetR/AcrR family transcriptional regulator n=1 Tax=Psychroserpens luteolus TaxID=2855840 RepID=UPI001E2E1620|nr:TetR/AcrR family transcriptional regulator [Psychroserpens luteolus]MCD2260385.1 TetR/AcrR family transcriptional regulator [Psychroserpens luteolus]